MHLEETPLQPQRLDLDQSALLQSFDPDCTNNPNDDELNTSVVRLQRVLETPKSQPRTNSVLKTTYQTLDASTRPAFRPELRATPTLSTLGTQQKDPLPFSYQIFNG